MSPEGISACARTIEELTADRDRWRSAYIRLASSHARWVHAACRDLTYLPHFTRLGIARRIIHRLKQNW